MSQITNLVLTTIADRIIVTFDPVTRAESYTASNGATNLLITDTLSDGRLQGTFTGVDLDTAYTISVTATVLEEDGSTIVGEAVSSTITTAGMLNVIFLSREVVKNNFCFLLCYVFLLFR